MTRSSFQSSTAQQLYAYRHNPLAARSFQILRRSDKASDYVPIGDYTVLDAEEAEALSEKKVINLVALLNGREGELIQLGKQTGARLLYHPIPRQSPDEATKIIFYNWEGKGVSHENAVLTIAEDFSR